jgi:hypothetical protein
MTKKHESIMKLSVAAIVAALILGNFTYPPLQSAEAGGKGLRVFLNVDTNLPSQDAEIDTFQYGRFLDTQDMYVSNGYYEYELSYPSGLIDEGPFEVCVYLVYDDIEECGSGYNGEEKEPESVYVNMLYD